MPSARRQRTRAKTPGSPTMIERITAIETSFENAMDTLADKIGLAVKNAMEEVAKSSEVEALKTRIELLEKAHNVQVGQTSVLAYWMDKAFPWAALTGAAAVAMRLVAG